MDFERRGVQYIAVKVLGCLIDYFGIRAFGRFEEDSSAQWPVKVVVKSRLSQCTQSDVAACTCTPPLHRQTQSSFGRGAHLPKLMKPSCHHLDFGLLHPSANHVSSHRVEPTANSYTMQLDVPTMARAAPGARCRRAIRGCRAQRSTAAGRFQLSTAAPQLIQAGKNVRKGASITSSHESLVPLQENHVAQLTDPDRSQVQRGSVVVVTVLCAYYSGAVRIRSVNSGHAGKQMLRLE